MSSISFQRNTLLQARAGVVFSIVVTVDDQVRTGDPILVTIGEMVELRAVSDEPIIGVQWNVQGWFVADYTISVAGSMLTYVTAIQMQRNPLSFGWVAPGNYAVTCIIQTASGFNNVGIMFNVLAPTVTSFQSLTGAVTVGPYQGSTYIRFTGQGGTNIVD